MLSSYKAWTTEMTTTTTITTQGTAQATVTGLLLRYWGFGRALTSEEKDILLFALDTENKSLHAPTHLRALERLREQGVE